MDTYRSPDCVVFLLTRMAIRSMPVCRRAFQDMGKGLFWGQSSQENGMLSAEQQNREHLRQATKAKRQKEGALNLQIRHKKRGAAAKTSPRVASSQPLAASLLSFTLS